jgi:phage regulator Rha-like protein
MSSREIAERTGKRHDHVLRDIDNLLAELGETSPQLWGHLPDAYGRPQRVAFLPKDLTLTLVAGYSAPLRHRIVTRWMELEQAQAARPVVALPNFTDPAEAARAWALAYKDAGNKTACIWPVRRPTSSVPGICKGGPTVVADGWIIRPICSDHLQLDTVDLCASRVR